ncbi:hypothetical protein JIN85_09550 [Luteolibacter pohnpeiensis]|uniref:DUF4375 domain-containing protein n=1 Tax=Luteolibacter pohnpeiensis TaxID=454153 RepID=A0A934S897_9BACT|nr:hypothetical protein [Luteolibacter pohnpeiensis]MBK1882661.1 hypothetical protein [Luteolibacter pohnpeiensis]
MRIREESIVVTAYIFQKMRGHWVMIVLTFLALLSCGKNHPTNISEMTESEEIGAYAKFTIDRIPHGARVNGAYPGMTFEESAYADMYYFWQGTIINSGNVAGYFSWLEDRRADLEALGATGCLKALENLRPLYEQAVRDGRTKDWELGDAAYRQKIEELEEPAFEDDWDRLFLEFGRKHFTLTE